MKKLIFIITLIVISVVSGFYFVHNSQNKPKYLTSQAFKGKIVEKITASGIINPVSTTNVGTQVSGTIKEIHADFNTPVKKGQILAQIDPTLFEARVTQQQANLISAKANLAKLQATLANDRKTLERYKRLYDKDFIAKSEVDLAETIYNGDLAQVDAAKAQILQAEAGLKSAQTDLGYTRIVSPVDGVVISRNIDIGQTVAASFQTPTLFLVAQDLTKMQIYTSIAEADISKAGIGQEAEFKIDGYPDEIFSGKVVQVRNSPTSTQSVVTYDVVVSVDNKNMKLKPGMTANVTVVTSKNDDALLVPNECFRFTMHQGDNRPKYKEKGLWVLKNNEPLRVEIKTGISDEDNTEIVSGDIKPGDEIITGTLDDKTAKGKPKGPQVRMRMF